MHAIRSLLVLLLITVVPLAVADEGGFYVGLQAGYSAIDINESIELDDDINGQLYVGYMFNDWMGMELGYADLGSFEFKDDDDEDTIDYSGAHLAFVMEGEFTRRVNVFAKFGAYAVKTELDYKDTTETDLDGTDTGFYYQVGFAFPVIKMMDITLSWQSFSKIETLDVDNIDSGVDLYDLGVRFKF